MLCQYKKVRKLNFMLQMKILRPYLLNGTFYLAILLPSLQNCISDFAALEV